jgi:hypothetical protein
MIHSSPSAETGGVSTRMNRISCRKNSSEHLLAHHGALSSRQKRFVFVTHMTSPCSHISMLDEDAPSAFGPTIGSTIIAPPGHVGGLADRLAAIVIEETH